MANAVVEKQKLEKFARKLLAAPRIFQLVTKSTWK